MTLKKTKSNKLFKILLAVCCLTITVSIFNACRKIETNASINEDLTSKFFQIKGAINPTVQKVYDKIKQDNERYHQINKLAHNEGLAIWDKAIIKTKSKIGARNQQQRTADGGEEIVIIPLVLENAENVNAFLAARITDTVEVKLFSGNQYDDFPFGDNVSETAMSADALATEIIMLDNNVFGYTKFQLLDNRLFTKTDTSLNPTGTFARLSSFTSIDGCTIVPIYWDPDGAEDLCDCSGNETFDHLEWQDCPGVGGTGGGNNFGFGGTGGGGGGNNGYTGGGGGSSGGGLGWTPIEDEIPPAEDPCPKAQEAAKKMDSLFTKSKADSVLATIPNLATESNEKGFPIYKKISINPFNSQDTTITGYSSGNIQTGNDSSITMSFITTNLKFLASFLHTHPPKGYSSHSPKDLYELIEETIANQHFQGSFVASANGSQYVLNVTNYSQATAFLSTKSQYLNGSKWNDTTTIGKAFNVAFDYFKEKFDGNANADNLGYEMAMAAVLNQYNTGITLAKKNSLGEFKPIVVKTTIIPRRSIIKPEKIVYTQECL